MGSQTGLVTGLDRCEKIIALRYLYLQGTKVTEAGVKKLAVARPDLRIEWDGGTIEPKKK